LATLARSPDMSALHGCAITNRVLQRPPA
jgi:hypothetical protein